MIVLRAGDAEIRIDPALGGALTGWTWRGQEILSLQRGMGCFPLVPYANRIALGRFDWAGTQHRLALNFGEHPHSIHGIGWQRAWTPVNVGASHAVLYLRHVPNADWPFPFEAEQRIVLEPDALHLELAATNLQAAPAPIGLGFHPFFVRREPASLRFHATSVWQTDDTALAIAQAPVPAAFDFSGERSVGQTAMDHCFSGVNGSVRLDLGNIAVTMETALTHAQIFTPLGRDFLCAEPVTHAPNALNRPDAAAMSVPPEGTLAASAVFRVAAID